MRRTYVHAIWAWVVFYILAVINGVLRENFYVPSLGDLWGRVAGVAILVVAILVVVYIFLRRSMGALNRLHLYAIGVLWVALSALFELSVSRYVLGISWDTLLPLYDLTAGHMLGVVWLVELLAPIVMGYRMLGKREAKAAARAGGGKPAPQPTPAPAAQETSDSASGGTGTAPHAEDKPQPAPASPQSDEEPSGV